MHMMWGLIGFMACDVETTFILYLRRKCQREPIFSARSSISSRDFRRGYVIRPARKPEDYANLGISQGKNECLIGAKARIKNALFVVSVINRNKETKTCYISVISWSKPHVLLRIATCVEVLPDLCRFTCDRDFLIKSTHNYYYIN